jgi:hypothetical protein
LACGAFLADILRGSKLPNEKQTGFTGLTGFWQKSFATGSSILKIRFNPFKKIKAATPRLLASLPKSAGRFILAP